MIDVKSHGITQFQDLIVHGDVMDKEVASLLLSVRDTCRDVSAIDVSAYDTSVTHLTTRLCIKWILVQYDRAALTRFKLFDLLMVLYYRLNDTFSGFGFIPEKIGG